MGQRGALVARIERLAPIPAFALVRAPMRQHIDFIIALLAQYLWFAPALLWQRIELPLAVSLQCLDFMLGLALWRFALPHHTPWVPTLRFAAETFSASLSLLTVAIPSARVGAAPAGDGAPASVMRVNIHAFDFPFGVFKFSLRVLTVL